jgi:hypothetical protein
MNTVGLPVDCRVFLRIDKLLEEELVESSKKYRNREKLYKIVVEDNIFD